ncbi:hypothetical protein DFH07DRAFT_974025 [Mycena maculata]|uniref:Uncharacterized protein n=1 Tax=Mycena maculata TaxID=230809 RepID=A0AAD7HAR3_9AGAR|nr:hypothetical protein DFH07DRAFT_974025 [Mycena maculata]
MALGCTFGAHANLWMSAECHAFVKFEVSQILRLIILENMTVYRGGELHVHLPTADSCTCTLDGRDVRKPAYELSKTSLKNSDTDAEPEPLFGRVLLIFDDDTSICGWRLAFISLESSSSCVASHHHSAWHPQPPFARSEENPLVLSSHHIECPRIAETAPTSSSAPPSLSSQFEERVPGTTSRTPEPGGSLRIHRVACGVRFDQRERLKRARDARVETAGRPPMHESIDTVFAHAPKIPLYALVAEEAIRRPCTKGRLSEASAMTAASASDFSCSFARAETAPYAGALHRRPEDAIQRAMRAILDRIGRAADVGPARAQPPIRLGDHGRSAPAAESLRLVSWTHWKEIGREWDEDRGVEMEALLTWPRTRPP